MNLQETVLSALIPRTPSDKFDTDKALQELLKAKVSSKSFDDKYKYLFKLVLENSFKKTVVLDRDILESQLLQSKFTDEEKDEYRIIFSVCKEQIVPPDKLKSILPGFIEQQSSIILGNVLTTAARILSEGATIGKQTLKGQDDARKYMLRKMAGLQGMDQGTQPHGDLRMDMAAFHEEYENRKKNPLAGVKTGIREIDELTNGAQRGELWLVSAYSGEGKSTLMRNWMYDAVVNQKKNVVLATIEMPYKQVLRKMVSLHSLHSRFGPGNGLLDKAIRKGMLLPQEEIQMKVVEEDFETNVDYGIMYTHQIAHNETVAGLREKLMYLQTQFNIDCVYVDYAALLRPEFKKQSKINEVEDVLKDLKLLAMDFNEGEGIPIITAHQISRNAREKAEKSESKRYDINFLSDTSAAEKTADLVCWLLRTEEMRAQREVKVGIHKYRDDEIIPDFRLKDHYEYGKVGSLAEEEKKQPFGFD